MIHLVTGYAGHEHIQSEDEGAYNASFFGDGQYVMEEGNQFEGSIIDNNTVRILDGNLLMYGRHVRLARGTYEDLIIQTGTAGKNRNDLICMTYAKNDSDGTETAYLQVIKGAETDGTPVVPVYTDGNILEGAILNQMPLYKVVMEGIYLKEIVPMFTVIPTYKTLAEQYAAQFKATITALKAADILDSMEEIEANTNTNMFAGALAVKELKAGNVASATKLANSRTIRTNLGSTSTASFDGSANVTPGVTGTLPIDNGGTGATTAANARTNLGLGAAATKGIVTSITSGNTNVPTAGAVYTEIAQRDVEIETLRAKFNTIVTDVTPSPPPTCLTGTLDKFVLLKLLNSNLYFIGFRFAPTSSLAAGTHTICSVGKTLPVATPLNVCGTGSYITNGDVMLGTSGEILLKLNSEYKGSYLHFAGMFVAKS